MQTLVLGADYTAMEVTSWERAMTLLCEGKVEVVNEYEDKLVRTVSLSFRMPSVVRFIGKVRSTKRAIKFSRQNVWARDKGCCQYCGNRVPRHEVTYDHVLPRSKGGHTRWENIVTCCAPCNQRKSNRTPQEANMRLRSTPVKPKSLPNSPSFMLTYRKGMPAEWKQWMYDAAYWGVALDQD